MGGIQKMTYHDRGWGGPKEYDVIYEQPLMSGSIQQQTAGRQVGGWAQVNIRVHAYPKRGRGPLRCPERKFGTNITCLTGAQDMAGGGN